MRLKSLAVIGLSLALFAAPLSAEAHGWHGGGLIFGLAAAGAAVVTGVALLATAPFQAIAAAPSPYYAPPPTPAAYYGAPPSGYYNEPPHPVYSAPVSSYYVPAPAYYAPPTYYYYR